MSSGPFDVTVPPADWIAMNDLVMRYAEAIDVPPSTGSPEYYALSERVLRLQGHLGRERNPRRGRGLANGRDLVDAESLGRLALQLDAGNHVDRDVVLACVISRLADE